MILKILGVNKIILLFILLNLNASNSYSILDGGSGLSADELIDASRGIYKWNINMPSNPKEAREIWSNSSGVNFTMPSTLSQTGDSPREARSQDNADGELQYQTASTVGTAQTMNQTPSSQEVALSASINVEGNWSFRLRDSKTRVLALMLFQSEDAVYGTGTMNDGGDTISVSASGTLQADKLHLGVTSSGPVSLYRLSLATNGNSSSGEYMAFSPNDQPWIGIAEGIRIPSQT